ncbi:MAG: hypothetical protein IJ093_04695 [Bacilli bacterium]|nr:hypothetical protein [Bacilli bacterium]
MESKNKNALIGGLLAIVFVMAVGYAAFATQLQISATASTGGADGNAKWDVKLTSITAQAASTGTDVVYNASSATDGTRIVDTLTAQFKAQLASPGDFVTYDVVITNAGTFDAKVSAINFTDGNTAAITNTYDGIAVGNVIPAGETKTFTVTTTYNSSVTTEPATADKTSDPITLVITCVQNS